MTDTEQEKTSPTHSSLLPTVNKPVKDANAPDDDETVPNCIIWNKWCGQVCCLFGPVPCHCFCKGLPKIKESTSTRVMYLFMFVFTVILAVLALISEVPKYLTQNIAFINETCTALQTAGMACESFFGNFETVYKVCCGQLSLHILLIPITFPVKDSGTCVSTIHNGYWFWKWAWILVVNGAVFVFLQGDRFTLLAIVMRYIGMVGGCLFILVNLFFICQVTMDFNTDLLLKAEQNWKWHVLIWFLTLIALAVCGVIGFVLFKFYAVCTENRVIAVVNVAACVILLILTVIPGVGRGSKNADILQGAIVVSYILYQTWTAIHSRPPGDFNVEVLSGVLNNVQEVATALTTTATQSTIDKDLSNLALNSSLRSSVNDTMYLSAESCSVKLGIYGSSTRQTSSRLRYLGLTYYIFIALYKSVHHTTKHAQAVSKYTLTPKSGKSSKSVTVTAAAAAESGMMIQPGTCYKCKPKVKGGQNVIYNEQEQTIYNYCYLHFQFTCSILFVMMTLTHWFDPGSSVELSEWSPSWAAFWVEIITAWLLILVYILTLLLPIHCQDNQYYKSVADRIPLASEGTRLSIVKEFTRTDYEYYDLNNKRITDLGTFNGIIYRHDHEGALQPVREVKPVGGYQGTPRVDSQHMIGSYQLIVTPDNQPHQGLSEQPYEHPLNSGSQRWSAQNIADGIPEKRSDVHFADEVRQKSSKVKVRMRSRLKQSQKPSYRSNSSQRQPTSDSETVFQTTSNVSAGRAPEHSYARFTESSRSLSIGQQKDMENGGLAADSFISTTDEFNLFRNPSPSRLRKISERE